MDGDLYVTPIFDDGGSHVASWVYATRNGYYAEAICAPEQAHGEALDRLVDRLLVPEMLLESRRTQLADLEQRVAAQRRAAGLSGAVSSGVVIRSRPSRLTKLFGPQRDASPEPNGAHRAGEVSR